LISQLSIVARVVAVSGFTCAWPTSGFGTEHSSQSACPSDMLCPSSWAQVAFRIARSAPPLTQSTPPELTLPPIVPRPIEPPQLALDGKISTRWVFLPAT
jgi:hypothetical protein